MQKFAILVIVIHVLYSCNNKNQEQQQTTLSDSTAVDTIAIINDPKNNLNVQTNSFSEIDSSGIIMFPLSMGETKRGGGSFAYKEIPYSSYWNIVFYNTHTSAYYLLSDRKMLINNFEMKYSSDNNVDLASTKKHIFYNVTVEDYNKDKLLTPDDPEYLFVSDKDGLNFRQVSPKGYNLNSWQFIKSTNKLIIAVTKDSDKNNKFDDNDEVSSFQIDIDKETLPAEIFSTDFKNKLKVMYDRDWKRIKK